MYFSIPIWLNTTFQDPASYNFITKFYDICMSMLSFVTLMVTVLIFSLIYRKYTNFKFINNHIVEFLWAILPFFLLIIIILPSLNSLYMINTTLNPETLKNKLSTFKITGHQWHWEVEEVDIFKKITNKNLNIKIDAGKEELPHFHMTDTKMESNKIILKTLITRNDVIHSWFIPTLGVKVDAIPGRISEQIILLKRNGRFFGTCTEFCGVIHRHIPFCLISNIFNYWK